MKYKLKSYNIWELGAREKQEDSIFPAHQKTTDDDRLFILCDGMGGHSAGEVASSTVCEALSASIFSRCPDPEGAFTDDDFRAALSDAYDALDTKDNGASKKMGTTLTFLKFHDKGCTIAHIGDSRVYHIRPGETPSDTEILFQTRDHSLVNDLVKIGELTPEEAKHSKQKNIITRAMQPCMERRPRADIRTITDIRPSDYFMLCSDGILEQMEDEDIQCIFSQTGGDAPNKVDILIDVTKENRDNHSAFLVHVTDVIDPLPVPTPTKADDTQEAESTEAEATASVKDETPKQAPKEGKIVLKCSIKKDKLKLIFAIAAAIILAITAYSTYRYVVSKVSGNEQQEAPVKPAKLQQAPPMKPARPVPQKNDAATAAQQPSGQIIPTKINTSVPSDENAVPSDAQIATDIMNASKK